MPSDFLVPFFCGQVKGFGFSLLSGDTGFTIKRFNAGLCLQNFLKKSVPNKVLVVHRPNACIIFSNASYLMIEASTVLFK